MKVFFSVLLATLLFVGIGDLINDISSARGWFFLAAGIVIFLVVFGSRFDACLRSGSSASDWTDFDTSEGGDSSGCD